MICAHRSVAAFFAGLGVVAGGVPGDDGAERDGLDGFALLDRHLLFLQACQSGSNGMTATADDAVDTETGRAGILCARQTEKRRRSIVVCLDSTEFALVVVQAERDGEGHVGAGAEAGKRNLILVDAKFVCVVGHVQHSIYTVLDSGREGILGSQAVVDTDDDSSAFVDDGSTPTSIITRAAQSETSTVEVDDTRVSLLAEVHTAMLLVVFGHIEVQVE